MKTLKHDVASSQESFLTAAEVGKRLRLPLSTVYSLTKSGKLPAVRFGRSYRFPAHKIEQLMRVEERRLRILVVASEEATRVAATDALRHRGCHVVEARDAAEALELARKLELDALLVDLRLPGANSMAFIRQHQGNFLLSMMAIVSTARSIEQLDALLSLGAVTLLRKPLSAAQLSECVEGIARERSSTEA